MEALTISKLNEINSEKNMIEFKSKKHNEALEECVLEINEILSRHWHLKEDGKFHHCVGDYPVWDYNAFYDAQKMFLENGIEITYYQPHRNFSFKLRA